MTEPHKPEGPSEQAEVVEAAEVTSDVASSTEEPAPRPWPARWIYLLLITLAVGAADQVSKQWAQYDLQPVRQQRVLKGYVKFNLTYVRNPGAAWGFLARSDESFRRPFFLVISCVAMVFILYLFLRLLHGQVLLMTALALVMGGAVGNFIDRIRYNYVVDFLDFRVGGFKWPTFNVADVAITVGVIFLFAEMFLLPWVRRRAQNKAASEEGS
jgi:signal peptidase II